jgi:hypothetical protein
LEFEPQSTKEPARIPMAMEQVGEQIPFEQVDGCEYSPSLDNFLCFPKFFEHGQSKPFWVACDSPLGSYLMLFFHFFQLYS